MHRIDNWIDKGSGRIIESIDGEYVNISAYNSLIGSTYSELSDDLKHSRKVLIKIKNNDDKCFLWYHIGHLNFTGRNPQRIARRDKEMISKFDYVGIKFPVSRRDYCKIERQNNICVNIFCYENTLTYPVYLSNQGFKDCMDLLLISNENKYHYVYIKDFNRFMFNKTRCKNKKYFCKCCLQCFSSGKVLIDHKKQCSIIHGKQSVKLKGGTISLKNYCKQLPVPFKIYDDFECIPKGVKSSNKTNGSYTEKYQNHISRSFAYKVVCNDNKLRSMIEEYDYCKKMIKKHFNKNLVMSAEEEEEEERFQLSNNCWICEKLFDAGYDEVRDHCHIRREYRGAAH